MKDKDQTLDKAEVKFRLVESELKRSQKIFTSHSEKGRVVRFGVRSLMSALIYGQ